MVAIGSSTNPVTDHVSAFVGWMSGNASDVCTILAFLLAAWVFLREAHLKQFEICLRLSEDIERRWERLHKEGKTIVKYEILLTDILNHYERCACYINGVRFLRGTPLKMLQTQIVETVSRNLREDFFQKTWAKCCSGPKTFSELKQMLHRVEKLKIP